MAQALDEFDRAIKQNPLDAHAYKARGDYYLAQRNLEHAIADFSEAIGLNAKMTAAYVNRGAAYLARSDWDLAIADFTSAIALDPKQSAAYLNRGQALGAEHERERAIADFTKAIRLDSGCTGCLSSPRLLTSGSRRQSRRARRLQPGDQLRIRGCGGACAVVVSFGSTGMNRTRQSPT